MRIEKLNENKIRIFLDLDDLKEKNIDLHDFMSNSLETQDLFFDLLNQAESEVGFITHNYKLIIEALASSDGNFIFTITRTKPESSALHTVSLPKPKARRQFVTPNKLITIYKFNSFDDFCEFCNYINQSSLKEYLPKLKNSSLVFFKDNYYLILKNLKLKLIDLKKFAYEASEFSSRIKNESIYEAKLKEYGKMIFSKNAISNCLEYFKI